MYSLENDSPNDTQPISQHASADVPSAEYQTGQTGHVDLIRGFEQSIIERQPASQDVSDEETDPLSQPTQTQIVPFPEENRFRPPQTPAMVGRSHDWAGKVNSQRWSTPRLPRNPFGNQNGGLQGVMNASQVFKATQYSSPAPQQLLSDALTERPSPTLFVMQHPPSSEAMSSPAHLTSLVSPVTRYEPMDRYVSIKESQARRQTLARTLGDGMTAKDTSDDDFDSEGSLVRRRRKRQRLDDLARAELSAIGTGGTAGARRTRQPLRTKRSSTSPIAERPPDEAEEILVSSDATSPIDDLTEEETEREIDAEDIQSDSSIDELAEENKENIATSGIQVPRTVTKVNGRKSFVDASLSSPSRHPTRQWVLTPPLPKSHTAGLLNPQESLGTVRQSRATNVDSVAVADSQCQPTSERTQQANLETSSSRQNCDALGTPKDYVPASQPPEQEEANAARQLTSSNVPPPEIPEGIHSSSLPIMSELAGTGQAQSQSQGYPIASVEASTAPKLPVTDPSSKTDSLIHRIDHASTTSRTEKPHFRASTNSKSDGNKTSFSGEGARSVIPETESVPATRTNNYSIISKRSNAVSSTSTSARSRTQPHSGTKSLSGQSTAFITAPTSIKRSPASTANVEQDLVSVNDSRATGEERKDGIHPDIAASHSGKAYQAAPESSSPVTAYRPRRYGQKRMQVEVLSSESKPAADNTEDELALSTTSSSSPVSSAPSADNPALYAVRGVPAYASAIRKDAPNNLDPISGDHVQDSALQSKYSDPAEIISNRVLAHFNGKPSAYYPATCIEVIGGEEPRYMVRFDDGGDAVVNAYGVKKLEFRPGDPVKVDARDFRKHTYIVDEVQHQTVSSLFPQIENARLDQAPDTYNDRMRLTDVFGNQCVTVSLKSNGEGTGNEGSEKFAIPIDRIYVTQSMWASYRDRPFRFTHERAGKASEPPTPADSTSDFMLPTSRHARTKASVSAPVRQIQSLQSKKSPLFSNMVFAITNVASDEARTATIQDIQSNGGTVLDSRLDDLFHVPDLSPIPSEESEYCTPNDRQLQLKEEATIIEFACVIADKHCRMAKYIQALALGIPCLSRRWISNCVAQQQVLPWRSYLLAAGESSYHYDAVVSRDLPLLPTDNFSIFSMVDARPRLLKDQNLLLIMSKREEEKMKHMPLISHALGARKISRVYSAEEAVRVVTQPTVKGNEGFRWDWVYSHNNADHVTNMLSNGAGGGTSKKGKRTGKREASSVTAARHLPRVVGNEFVIQCLIAGRLID